MAKMETTLYDQFIQDVESNPENHCEYVRLAVKRHLDDLKKSKEKDWPYVFDRKLADQYIEIVKTFKHTKGDWRGKLFNLTPSQAFVTANIFGWVEKGTGLRRFFIVYYDAGRGTGKSEFAAVIQSVMFCYSGENTPNIVSCATTRKQANYVFKPTKIMLRQYCNDSSYFNDTLKILTYHVEETITDGILTTMTADSAKEDGMDLIMATVDELHAHKDTSLIKIIETGLGKRKQPMLLIVTTAGHNKTGPGQMYRKITRDVLSGNIENDGFFGMVFTLDDKEEVHDPTKWNKALPNLPDTPDLRVTKQQYLNAMSEGATAMYEFMTKNMNMYVDSPKTWIEEKFIKAATVESHPTELLINRACYIGLDLSQSEDITAAPILFLPINDDPFFRVMFLFWCPEDNKLIGVKSVDGVDYRPWIENGYIYATSGNIIDYEHIRKVLNKCAEQFNVKCIEYDPKYKSQIIPHLQEDGINCESYSQGFAAMTPAVKWLYEMIVSESPKIKIEYNPVFNWMMSNVVIKEYEGGMRMSKDKSQGKIDGPVALCNAVGGFLTDEKNEKKSRYEEEGLRMI